MQINSHFAVLPYAAKRTTPPEFTGTYQYGSSTTQRVSPKMLKKHSEQLPPHSLERLAQIRQAETRLTQAKIRLETLIATWTAGDENIAGLYAPHKSGKARRRDITKILVKNGYTESGQERKTPEQTNWLTTMLTKLWPEEDSAF